MQRNTLITYEEDLLKKEGFRPLYYIIKFFFKSIENEAMELADPLKVKT